MKIYWFLCHKGLAKGHVVSRQDINNAIEFAVLSQIVMWKETTRW